MVELFLGLSLWSILVLVIGVLITTILVTYDFDFDSGPGTGWGAIISIVIFAIICAKLENVTVKQYDSFLFESLTSYILYFVAYFFAGVIWSFFRWYLFLKDYFKQYKKADIKLSDHTRSIMLWIGYWPFSMFGIIATKPIQATVEFLYNIFVGVYKWILKKAIQQAGR